MLRLPRLLLALAIGGAIPLMVACATESPVEPIRPPREGCGETIPGEYIVMFKAGVNPDVESAALAAKYTFTVRSVYRLAFSGFAAANVSDSAAAGLAAESTVSVMSPNATVCVD